MIYREYGTTGKAVSAIGFGGMRFKSIDDADLCVEMMVEAAKGGINYFDTAPKYFGDRSERVFGKGFAELSRLGLPFFCSTKTNESTEAGIRKEIEAQLRRLGREHIDFYHVWCITDLPTWEKRKTNGVIETFGKLKDEGLIRHICVSSHLIGDQIRNLLLEGVFEGVLFGYSAYNFRTRRDAFDAVRSRKLGCAVMNPLGGGIIPRNPDLFGFLKTRDEETIVEAALRFLLAHEDITVSLVGFETLSQVKEALNAANGYVPIPADKLEAMKAAASASFDGICTGCRYCDGCPEGIRIPQLMDAYNQKILYADPKDPFPGKKKILERLNWHWGIPPEEAGRCAECGRCESACTQHLDIVGRLGEISGLKEELRKAAGRSV